MKLSKLTLLLSPLIVVSSVYSDFSIAAETDPSKVAKGEIHLTVTPKAPTCQTTLGVDDSDEYQLKYDYNVSLDDVDNNVEIIDPPSSLIQKVYINFSAPGKAQKECSINADSLAINFEAHSVDNGDEVYSGKILNKEESRWFNYAVMLNRDELEKVVTSNTAATIDYSNNNIVKNENGVIAFSLNSKTTLDPDIKITKTNNNVDNLFVGKYPIQVHLQKSYSVGVNGRDEKNLPNIDTNSNNITTTYTGYFTVTATYL